MFSGSFSRIDRWKEDKWWLPVPYVPPGGLPEESRKNFRHRRDCANQIHKAAMAINSSVLSEMDIPETYMATLPKVLSSSEQLAVLCQILAPYGKKSLSEWFSSLSVSCPIDAALQSGRSSLGDWIYKQMYVPDKFSPDHLLDCLNITSEHEALELADKVEASMHTWQRKAGLGHSKSSWDLVMDFISETDHRSDKNTILAERAKSLLFYLK